MPASGVTRGENSVQILYRDEHLVAVDKPAGLLVHRSRIDRRESRFLLQMVRDQIGSRVHPVHRLDKGTSGVLLFALHEESARRLADAFRDGAVCKTYVAVVRGYAPEQVVVDHALRDRRDSFAPREIQVRSAVTEITRIACAEFAAAVGRYQTARYSLVSCRPETGRRHQVRRHLKHLRHPIIGDANYGDGAHNRFFRNELGVGRLLLAATSIGLQHPFTGQEIYIEAGLDDWFRGVLMRPEWHPCLAEYGLSSIPPGQPENRTSTAVKP